MKKISLLILFLGFLISFSYGQDSTDLISESIIETTDSDEDKPSILFWISCFIAGALPWVFMYFMKQRNQHKK